MKITDKGIKEVDAKIFEKQNAKIKELENSLKLKQAEFEDAEESLQAYKAVNLALQERINYYETLAGRDQSILRIIKATVNSVKFEGEDSRG